MSDRNTSVLPEPFVSAAEAAKFLGISRRFLLSLARRGIGGAMPSAATDAIHGSSGSPSWGSPSTTTTRGRSPRLEMGCEGMIRSGSPR